MCEKCAKERYSPPSQKLYARFSLEGYKKIEANMVEKGNSWKKIAKRFLLFKLDEYIKAEKWVDAANICFFLWAREMDK